MFNWLLFDCSRPITDTLFVVFYRENATLVLSTRRPIVRLVRLLKKTRKRKKISVSVELENKSLNFIQCPFRWKLILITAQFRIEIVLDLTNGYTTPTNKWLLKLFSNSQIVAIVFFTCFWITLFKLRLKGVEKFWPPRFVVLKVIVKEQSHCIDDNHKCAFYFNKTATKY